MNKVVGINVSVIIINISRLIFTVRRWVRLNF